ncbi:hypothetical protein [Streptomyces collinus]|uniref:hypothetical protein n=1 Tax=Streptomyces collinus TaxID=42684 RepID=UPI0036AB7EC0
MDRKRMNRIPEVARRRVHLMRHSLRLRRAALVAVAALLIPISLLNLGSGRAVANSGFTQGTLAVAKNGNGNLELFSTDGVNEVWHRAQKPDNGGWTNWEPFTDGQLLWSLAAETNAKKLIEVFGIDSQERIWHRVQIAAGTWGDWQLFDPGARLVSISVARNKSGRLEVFGSNAQGQVWHRWETEIGGAWSQWVLFNGGLMKSVAAETNKDGRIELFATNGAGEIFHRWQTQPDVVTTDNRGWSLWEKVDGTLSSISVTRNFDGRLELFGANSDGLVWHRWQNQANAAGIGGWSQWASFDGAMRSVTADANEDGRLELFGVETDGDVQHRWQKLEGGWTVWADLPGTLPVMSFTRAKLDVDTEIKGVKGGPQPQSTLVARRISLRAGESRVMEAQATARMTSGIHSSADFLVGIQCVDSANAQLPDPAVTSFAQTSLLPGNTDRLLPRLLFTAPATDTYTCMLVASTSPEDTVVYSAQNTFLSISNHAPSGSHWWQNPVCESAGEAPSCTYIGGDNRTPFFDVFSMDEDAEGRVPYTWTAASGTDEISARANLALTTCGATNSCNFGKITGKFDNSTVRSYLQVTQLDAQGRPCKITRTANSEDVIKDKPHHYNIPYTLDNIPVFAECGSRKFQLLVHLQWISGNVVKIDGTSPDKYPSVSTTNGFLYN